MNKETLMELLTKLGSEEASETQYTGILQKIKTDLQAMPEVRVFVDCSANFGHQSSTITLMKQFIDWVEYTNQITIIFKSNSASLIETPNKLALLLPGIDVKKLAEDPASVVLEYRTCKKIHFAMMDRELHITPSLSEYVPLGFTGGSDNDDEIHVFLKTNYFICLQPYMWYRENRIEIFASGKETKKITLEDDPSKLIKKAIFQYNLVTVSHLDASVWNWYKTQFCLYDCPGTSITINQARTAAFRHRIECAEQIEQRKAEALLWPVYGLQNYRYHCENVLEGQLDAAYDITGEILFSLVMAGIRCSMPKPIVMLLFNTVKKRDSVPEPKDFDLIEEDLFSYLNAFIKGESALTDLFLLKDMKVIINPKNIFEYRFEQNDTHTQGVVEQDVIQLRRELEPDASKSINTIHMLDNLGQTPLTAGHIYIVKVGSMPMDVFNYFFSIAGMPPFFEGQGTSSLVINLGRPFLQCSQAELSRYPSRTFATMTDPLAQEIYETVMLLAKRFLTWKGAHSYRKFIDNLSLIISNSYKSERDEYKYFNTLQEVYSKPQHGKMFLGLIRMYFYYKNSALDLEGLMRLRRADKILVLEDVYEALIAAIESGHGNADLVSALSGTKFSSYFCSVTGGSFPVAVGRENVKTEFDSGGRLRRVMIDRGSTFLFQTEFSFSLTFTYTEYTCSILSTLSCGSDGEWTLPGIPWIRLERFGFQARVSEGDLPIDGALTGFLKGTELQISIGCPIQEGIVLVRGEFAEPVSALEPFYQIAGGVNFIQSLPMPLREIGGFGLKGFSFAYHIRDRAFLFMEFSVGTEHPWAILQEPDFSITPQLSVTIFSPQDVLRRSVMFRINGRFTIGQGKIAVTASYPNFQLQALLVENEIDLNVFVALFGGHIDLKSSISAFQLTAQPDQSRYLLDVGVRSDWNFLNLFTITNVSLHVDRFAGKTNLNVSGDMILLPETVKMHLYLQGSYHSDTGSWLLLARQSGGGVLQIAELLLFYLGWKADEYSLPAVGMEFMLDSGTSDWQMTAGTQEEFCLPFLEGVSLTARMTFGSGRDAQGKESFYAMLSAQFQWNGIDLIFWYDYHPDVRSIGFTWNQLRAVVTRNAASEWVGAINFTEEVTLGSMIESMVSWVSGSRFGLEAPWNILDKLSLSGLQLQYNFTTKKVGFIVKLGDIDLGFAKITGIMVFYQSDGPQEERGVMVTLTGDFPWNLGETAAGDTHTLGPWDASQPGQAPSPNGIGNKYFDLDLLALGQHVTYDGFRSVTNVEEVIRLMRELPEGAAPLNHYDMQSSWMIGADLKILKLTGEGENGYLLRVQTVFNDPALYALRVILSGEAAKVLKGLEFQILYKKLSDHLGVFQAEITLPDSIRYINLGGVSITLPVIGVAVYTNGDFQVDIGFPWNNSFARSFSIEALVYPGIPLIGSGGFYFGMLSGETCSRVPAGVNGVFNPVLVFGLGLSVGVGKTLNCGILQAGFSLTVAGILEGVIAKWNPYQPSASEPDSHALDSSYYYCVQGTVGVIGRLYGSVDFCIIKASVNIALSLMLHFLVESYQPIQISVECSVDLSLSLYINLGLFKIKIHLSFRIKVKEGFLIQNKGQAPWITSRPEGVVRNAMRDRLTASPCKNIFFRWSVQRRPAAPLILHAYLVTSLTLAHDEWEDLERAPKAQYPCYAAMIFLEPSSFHELCASMLEWLFASGFGAEAEGQVIDENTLEEMIRSLSSTDENPTPLPLSAIREFLGSQVLLKIHDKPMEHDGAEDGLIENAVYFPMVPWLKIETQSNKKGFERISYAFSDYNEAGPEKLQNLRAYFDQLAVLVREEETGDVSGLQKGNALSLAEWVFTDYFLLISRQLLQYALDGLREYELPAAAGCTPNQMISQMNSLRGPGKYPEYTLYDLFVSNQEKRLNAKKNLTICGAVCQADPCSSFTSIADLPLLEGKADPLKIAQDPVNQNSLELLSAGAVITFSDGTSYTVGAGDSLSGIVIKLEKDLSTIAAQSDLLLCKGLIRPCAQVAIPPFSYLTGKEDTLKGITDRFGVTIPGLSEGPDAAQNGEIADLFSMEGDGFLLFPAVGQLYAETLIKQALKEENLKRLAAIATRYSLHGLRLTTDGISPLKPGIWVDKRGMLPPAAGLFALTGQQFIIPAQLEADEVFTVTFTNPGGLSWLEFDKGKTSYTISVSAESEDARRIENLAAYWSTKVLRHKLTFQGMGDMIQSAPLAYTFSSSQPVMRAGGLLLPCGTETGPLSQMKLWKFPDALTLLAGSPRRRRALRAAMLLGRYREADGTMSHEALNHYGLAAVVSFSIKKAVRQDCPMYEICGGKSGDIFLLERILAAQADSRQRCFSVDIAYPASQGGLQMDEKQGLEAAFIKVNLSTDTRPSNRLCRLNGNQEPSDSVRLLWEALITNQGGFYLYYCICDRGNRKGLPDAIFDEKGRGTVSLVVIFDRTDSRDSAEIFNYMNALITPDVPADPNLAPYAQVDLEIVENIPVEGTESIREFCQAYDSEPSDFAKRNAGLRLKRGAAIDIRNGVYLVSSEKMPGGILAQIASFFEVTVEELREANPGRADWPSVLTDGEALILPALTAIAGDRENSSLQQISAKYGYSTDMLAGLNQDRKGLFEAGQTVRLLCGCRKTTATVSPGIAASTFSIAPPSGSTEPETEARDTLMNLYTLLGYHVIENCDYIQSGLALPAGPRERDNTYQYSIALPLSKVRKGRIAAKDGLPSGADNPYGGVGTLLQLDYHWQDLYGNLIDSQMSRRERSEDGFINRLPVFQGYTDELIPVGSWPCVNACYQVRKDRQGQRYFEILFRFDSTKYEEYVTPPALKQAAGLDRKVYQSLYYQLTDPLGVDLTLKTSLFSGEIPGADLKEGLLSWLFYGEASLYRYLSALEHGECAVVPETEFLYRLPFGLESINREELFVLTCRLGLFRRKNFAAGGFASMNHILSVEYDLPPNLGEEASLNSFAESLEEALWEAGVSRIRLAAGLNQDSGLAGREALWIVRQGEQRGGGIWFQFQKNQELIMALRPISNHLEGKNTPVVFPVYQTGRPIGPQGPTQSMSFQGIDLDLWMKLYVEAIDELLSEEMAMAITRIDRILDSHSYDELLSQKQALASRLKDYLVPILKKDRGREIKDARESIRQQLLVKLSSLYEIQGAVTTMAEVSCSIGSGADEEETPVKLFGTMELTDSRPSSQITLSTSKLALRSGIQPLTYFIKSPELIRDDSGSILPGAALSLAFTGTNLEHQFRSLKGIEGYQASSWLNFVTNLGREERFRKETGEYYVPFLLRSYPEIPKLGGQSCLFPCKGSREVLNLNWNYRFGYERSCHYPQDRVAVKVHLNKKEGLAKSGQCDSLFDSLAALISLYPKIKADLSEYACKVTPDMEKDSREVVNGNAAILSFLYLSRQIVSSSMVEKSDGSGNLTEAAAYSFFVREEAAEIEGVRALVICVEGEPPAGLPWPSVSLGSEQYRTNLWKKEGHAVWYWFTDSATKKPLEAAIGQTLPTRNLSLENLYLLRWQSAASEFCIRRNEQSIGGSEIDDCFIYQTGVIRFSDTLYPSDEIAEPIDLPTFTDPVRKAKKLNEHITAFFCKLLQDLPGSAGREAHPDSPRQPVTVMMEVKYAYCPAVNSCPVELPVFLQPAVRLSDSQLAERISLWSHTIEAWRDSHITAVSRKTWNENAVLCFDLTILSDLAEKPMPLIHLRRLQLSGRDILL